MRNKEFYIVKYIMLALYIITIKCMAFNIAIFTALVRRQKLLTFLHNL